MKKRDITYQDKINELRLDITHPNNTGVNFIFVEGESDIKLFRKFFDLEKCKVENIPGGKIKLEECVSDLMTIYPLIIGIRDADFIHLNKIDYSKTNIFLTDYHDIEMTMLSQNVVLNSLVFEFTKIPKKDHVKFRNDMMKSIELIGYLKLLNETEDLELKFSSIGFQDLISFVNLEIDFTQYLKRVISKSNNAKIKNETIIQEKVNELMASAPELMQLTNGHDLLNTFAKYFREKTKHKGLTNENIASAFRMTFTVEHFQKTDLCKSLYNWCTANNTTFFENKVNA